MYSLVRMMEESFNDQHLYSYRVVGDPYVSFWFNFTEDCFLYHEMKSMMTLESVKNLYGDLETIHTCETIEEMDAYLEKLCLLETLKN